MAERQGRLSREEAYSRLYEAMHGDGSLDERLLAALEVGTAYLGVEQGYITEIDPETDEWEVVVSTTPDEQPDLTGLQEDLSNTFCRRTIREEGVFAFADADAAGMDDHPTTQNYGVHCYHGSRILVDGEPHGTVCFSSVSARRDPFSDAEKSFTHLLAGMAGYETEQREYERRLSERERELEERREVYRAVIDASFDFVFRFDREGRFTYTSPSTEAFLGYEPSELDGRPITDLHPDEETTERAWELIERVLDGETVEARDFPLETKSGSAVYTDIRAAPIYDGSVPVDERTPADIVAVQGMTRDATDRRRREGLISVINRVLRHNLRNAVSVIGGRAEMLEAALSGDQADNAAVIGATADRLLALSETARTLEQNRDLSPELEAVDVVPLVDSVVTDIRARYPEASVTVTAPETAVANTLPRLETALWELTENAAKHGDEAVTIEVAVDPDAVVVAVADDGPGLPDLEREVLASGEETQLVHGTGLGLWLVYWIVTSLDGSLDVTTDAGTTVEIRLPRPS